MKHKKVLWIAPICLLLIGIIILLSIISCFKFAFIGADKILYEKSAEYIKEERMNTDYCKDEQDFQVFTAYDGFGSYKDKNYTYVFIWINEESYYTKDGNLYLGSGSAIPYKFTFKDNEVISYEMPQDGTQYGASIAEWFPKHIRFLSYWFMDNKSQLAEDIEEQVKEHYSYIEPFEIQFDTD